MRPLVRCFRRSPVRSEAGRGRRTGRGGESSSFWWLWVAAMAPGDRLVDLEGLKLMTYMVESGSRFNDPSPCNHWQSLQCRSCSVTVSFQRPHRPVWSTMDDSASASHMSKDFMATIRGTSNGGPKKKPQAISCVFRLGRKPTEV